MPRLAPEVRVSYAGDRRALSAITVRHIVRHLLKAERALASVTVTFLSAGRMRGLNRRSFGKDRATDVIAYSMYHNAELIGDVFVCPAVARRSAREHRIAAREELCRLVIHGVLHVLGYDHPPKQGRITSDMWQRQERYVSQLVTT